MIAPKSLQGNRTSSCIKCGISLCFLSYTGKLCVPLELQQRSQGTFHVASGKSELLSGCEVHLRIPLKSLLANTASSRVEAGNSVVLSTFDSNLEFTFVFQQWRQALSHFEA